ncbi:efflux transporter outer membrane subunit [Roseicyclus marinus]|uniref:efflux transporter outer membrane subunit n=1 Tax=Roseicyclus marinus TaxID=2161673 RepID=UPI00240F8A5A|nr:efflux transporter outer membrane subunit [Roseicyclus marinus]MDG3039901.1 efflux transporter outer membrane subunit [Roseicyclus marinus]
MRLVDLFRRGLPLAAVLAACAPVPDLPDIDDGRTEIAAWFPARFSAAASRAEQDPGALWWSSFSSGELNGVVLNALDGNYDLQSALARLEQARTQVLIDNAQRSPSVDVSPSLGIDLPEGGIGTAINGGSQSARQLWQAGMTVNYELNLMGRERFATRAAFNRALASEFAREALVVSLISEVARTYFEVVAMNERVEVAERNLAAITAITQGVQARLDRGDATLVDVLQQRILQNNTSAEVNALILQREQVENRLATLLGRPPSAVNIHTASLATIAMPSVDPGLPSDLLCRRPDIRRAEANLVSAELDLQAARANLFPSISLTASAGLGSFELADLLSPQSIFLNSTGSLIQNVFDGGRRRGEFDQATQRNRELLADYANTVVTALREVEDALSGVELTTRQYLALREASDLAQQMLDLSVSSVERGGLDYLQLLDTQRTALQTQDREIVARLGQLQATVDLVKALGGGFGGVSSGECVQETNSGAEGAVH